MFKKLLSFAAAKASITNIRFDIDRLRSSFPHDVPKASKAIFSLLENISMALSNNAAELDVRNAIQKATEASPDVSQLAHNVLDLVLAVRRKDTGEINSCDAIICGIFKAKTGSQLNVNQITLLGKLALPS